MKEIKSIEKRWEELQNKLFIGSVIVGEVLFVQPFGIFIDIGYSDIRGFIRVVNISDNKNDKVWPSVGDIVKTIILDFTAYNYEVCLSLKESDFKRYSQEK